MMKMTIEKALTLLDLKGTPSKEELKKAYYKAVKRVHPDFGGSESLTKEINLAYELLSETKFTVQQDRDAFINKSKEIAEGISRKLGEAYKETKFLEYLESLFNISFSADSKIEVRQGFSTYNVRFFASFVSSDSQTSVNINGYIDTVHIMTSTSETLTSGEFDIPVTVDILIVHNNKKVKPYRQNYLISQNSKFVFSPEDLIPREKMKKAIKSSKERKFSKQDMIAALRSNLNASFDGEYATIQIRNKFRLVFYRYVMLRQAAWGCSGFYQTNPHKKLLQGAMTLPESEETLKVIEHCVRNLESASDEEMLEVAKREILALEEESRRIRS